MEIQLKRFKLHTASTLAQWLTERGLDASVIDELPRIGYVAYHKGLPISAAFLRLMEGDSTSMVDSMVSDPKADAKLRDQANSLLTDRLIQEARVLGLKQVIALSIDPNTIERAKRHGFAIGAHTLLVKCL